MPDPPTRQHAIEAAAKAMYDATGKQHGGFEDGPRKGIRTYRQFEWEELAEDDKSGVRRHADAALTALEDLGLRLPEEQTMACSQCGGTMTRQRADYFACPCGMSTADPFPSEQSVEAEQKKSNTTTSPAEQAGEQEGDSNLSPSEFMQAEVDSIDAAEEATEQPQTVDEGRRERVAEVLYELRGFDKEPGLNVAWGEAKGPRRQGRLDEADKILAALSTHPPQHEREGD